MIEKTISETIAELHYALRDYIEATYHISHEKLVKQRHDLLNQSGVISQRPYIETTPRYQTGKMFSELGLPTSVTELFRKLSVPEGSLPSILPDPLYTHQSKALQESILKGKSLLITTGTGSGKTECFLLPILAKIAEEASNGSTFRDYAAVRAIVLYPMNALVNDQLGRMRLMFGDQRVINTFKGWGGRPLRFARYTSRTLYPGVRDEKKDKVKLAPIGNYFVHFQELAQFGNQAEKDSAIKFINELKKRGKWPAKADLLKWYGKKGSRWTDKATGSYKRCVTLPDDAELLTRHEVLAIPPDILVTNYSMLEYMLMRPIERPIFNQTQKWLADNPTQKLILVVDEAHLYSGAAGTEVALLLRRLRQRLGISQDRLQLICTSASFQNANYAPKFAAHLAGKLPEDFVTLQGDLLIRDGACDGSSQDAELLQTIDPKAFYDASDKPDQRSKIISQFLAYRKVSISENNISLALYEALKDFGPMLKLINLTMREATPIERLGELIFPKIEKELANRAVTALMALGSNAKKDPKQPSLIPCRIHGFHRGLPGLWVCLDPMCSELPPDLKGGPTGKLYTQPRERCGCGAKVFELFTCRNCGTAYARTYIDPDNLQDPDFLWSEPGGAFRTLSGSFNELLPLDLLLEEPVTLRDESERANLDLITGRLNPRECGSRTRPVFIKKDRQQPGSSTGNGETQAGPNGEFCPCAVCGETATFGRSTVQDHQTKGDEPFQTLISQQIKVQPPNQQPATKLAPLRGRKVLIFSDSRQTAARLAPNLQKYSLHDALRPLIVTGYKTLQQKSTLQRRLSLDDIFLAVLVAAKKMEVRLRPELNLGESFEADRIVTEAVQAGAIEDDERLLDLAMQVRAFKAPCGLYRSIVQSINHRYYGLESLGLATLIEHPRHQAEIEKLACLPGFPTSASAKLSIARLWIRCWRKNGFWLGTMPLEWWQNEVRGHAGIFQEMTRFLQTQSKDAAKKFKSEWVPALLNHFTEQMGNKYRLKGSELTFLFEGDWGYCQACRTTQRLIEGITHCINCSNSMVQKIDPSTDRVFMARKGYYRRPVMEALQKSQSPIVLIASEHTAQLNAAQSEDIFSKAEENELLFQDVDLGVIDGKQRPAIDVLCSTTTMEVGIDIGTLSGVSLRNMPPARANYQQRAGRAGRRGNAIATVTAFGSADSHDEHYFTHPDQMIRGQVKDPTLTLDNDQIAQRHITAYLLQQYHQFALPTVKPEEQPQLFAVLGTVGDFKQDKSILSRKGFEAWLKSNRVSLRGELDNWLPKEITESDRACLLNNFVERTLSEIDKALKDEGDEIKKEGAASHKDEASGDGLEIGEELEEEKQTNGATAQYLLDRLLYNGVLPRYAFPTDVATFYVFDQDKSTNYKPAFQYTPSQGLSIALTQYAPGKEIWVGGKLWRAGAIYSPLLKERPAAWENKKLYFECSYCHYAKTVKQNEATKGEKRDCEACGQPSSFGEARYWLRPPGFAHPVDLQEGTSPDDQPARSYATRAKLTAPTPSDTSAWRKLNEHLRIHFTREHLLVSNTGPKGEGYTYCVKCGKIEPTNSPSSALLQKHRKPFPDSKEPECLGGATTKGLVLGTDFISDVLLISCAVSKPLSLRPGALSTNVALRTLCEALSTAACSLLELDPKELQAEFRPALTQNGWIGKEAEIYIYDTLPGGAGFSRRVGDLGLRVFECALKLLEECPDNCDASCYRCLRSYKNKFEHGLLDRHLGAGLLRYLLNGTPMSLDPRRIERATNLLFEDLCRQQVAGLTLTRNDKVSVDGIGDVPAPILAIFGAKVYIIDLHTPLTLNEPVTKEIKELQDYSTSAIPIVIDELLVRKNLPRATMDVIQRLKG